MSTYQEYLKRCRAAQLSVCRGRGAEAVGTLEASELAILRGDQTTARTTVSALADPREAYLQAVKAFRHFEDPTFLRGTGIPAAKADWLLPMLRAAGSVAGVRGDADEVERRARVGAGRGAEAVRAFIIVANAHRNAGNLEASRRVLHEAFALAARVAPQDQPARRGPDLLFTRRRQAAFRDLLRVADFRRHSVFPCSGTLLGFYRDQDFIPSDGDVDLGCLDPDGFEAIKAAMRASGCFLLSPGRLPSNFNARHVTGPKFDVSLYVTRGDGWAKTSHVYEWRFARFALGELATDYGRLPAPAPAEEYLGAMYEDWWVPRSGYDSRIDSPNLTHVSPGEVVLVLASHVLGTYLEGGNAACAGWRRKLERLPAAMRKDVAGFLAPLE